MTTVVLPRLKRGARLRFRLTHHWPDDAIEVRTKEPLIQGRIRVTWRVNYDGSGKAPESSCYVDGKPRKSRPCHDSLSARHSQRGSARDRQ